MLVLSRQKDETIIIGDDIEITVVDIRGDKVRLGVSAPKEISVHRKEVYDAIRRENPKTADLVIEIDLKELKTQLVREIDLGHYEQALPLLQQLIRLTKRSQKT